MQQEDIRERAAQDSETQLTYSSYLKVDDLLALQKPLSSPVAHDELLFITIHQAYELWFKVSLFELDAFVKHIFAGDAFDALRRLERVHEIFKVLVQQIDILETMTPMEFNRFRANIRPASGFQSWQFRELELLAGGDVSECQRLAKLNPEWRDRIQNRLGMQTLRDAFLELLRRDAGLDPTEAEAPEIEKAVTALYTKSEKGSLTIAVCESLIRLDEDFQLWRFRHVQMVERMIGMKQGTGASLGVKYLQTTLNRRFFPELWALRTSLGNY